MEELNTIELMAENRPFSCICTNSEKIKEVLQQGDTSKVLNLFLLSNEEISVKSIDEINIFKSEVRYIDIYGISYLYAFPIEQFLYYE